ncbi:MAG: ABC transporter permease [Caldilineaceae bacterium]
MTRFILRSLFSAIFTMLIVSLLLFFMVEYGRGDITVKILGIESTPEQRASYRNQLGLNQSPWTRYFTWLAGNDWWLERRVDRSLVTVRNPQTGEPEWWTVGANDELLRWQMQDGELIELIRQPDGSAAQRPAPEESWFTAADGTQQFWGVNNNNSVVRWVRGAGAAVQVRTKAGFRVERDSPVEFIPLSKGLVRGDPGESLRTGRPVAASLPGRVQKTAVLALLAFVVVMPLALLFGIIAGINEGRFLDRAISITGLALTATPEFVTGMVLILIFGIWLKWLPAVSVFFSDQSIFELLTNWNSAKILVLPVLTLTAVELGYVARMTRTSMVEVMNSSYIRTAIIKGLPYRMVVMRHAVRNALIAPITVIMLHVNWLVGGVVIVEVVFGYPGLGTYIYDSAIFGDFNAVEAAAMVTVAIAVITRIIGDVAYILLNPRIRYS